jgi:hypothetical protein
LHTGNRNGIQEGARANTVLKGMPPTELYLLKLPEPLKIAPPPWDQAFNT